MQFLIKLVTPPGGNCCDPFNGSGTTGIACKMLGVDYYGLEQSRHDCNMSEARIAAWDENTEYEKQRIVTYTEDEVAPNQLNLFEQ